MVPQSIRELPGFSLCRQQVKTSKFDETGDETEDMTRLLKVVLVKFSEVTKTVRAMIFFCLIFELFTPWFD